MSEQCINCDAALRPKDKFCPACGQSAKLKRLSMKQIRKEFVKRFLDYEKGLIFLLKQLALRPGEAVGEYIAGKRKRYYDPLKFVALGAGISVIATHYFDVMTLDTAHRNPVSDWISRHMNLIVLSTIPIAAWFSRLLFRKHQFNYAEHLTLHAYLGGFRTVFFLLVFTPLVTLFRAYYFYILAFYTGLWMLYISWANVQLFKEGWPMTILKTTGLVIMTQIVMFLLILVGVIVVKLLGWL